MLHGVIRVPNVRSEANGGAFPIAPFLIVPKNYEDKGQIRVPTDRNALRQFLATVHQNKEPAERPTAVEPQKNGRMQPVGTPPIPRARPSKKSRQKAPDDDS